MVRVSLASFPLFFPRTDFLSGREQATAPTMATNQPPKRNRTTVGAIPCGRPALAEGTSFTRLVHKGSPLQWLRIHSAGRSVIHCRGNVPCGCPGAGM